MPSAAVHGTQLDRIEAAIIGNGREGLLGRTARIEEKLVVQTSIATEAKITAELACASADRAARDAEKNISVLAISINKLTEVVDAHHKKEHFSELIKKKSFLVSVALVVIVLQLITMYLPNLWDAIVITLGAPHLTIPLMMIK